MAALMNYGVNTNLNGVNGFGRQPARSNLNLIGVVNTKVSATTDTSVTVPLAIGAGALASDKPNVLVLFGYQNAATVFVALGATAAPDASGTFTASNGVINPSSFLVKGGSVLHFYPLADAYCSIEFYSTT